MNNSFFLKTVVILLSLLVHLTSYAEDLLPKEVTSLGVAMGQSYPEAVAKLKQNGWAADTSGSIQNPPYAQYPEITCGEGVNQICSAGFSKGSSYVVLVVSQTPSGLVINGSY